MKEQDIQAGNKLIAEFHNFWSYGDGTFKTPTEQDILELRYHTSWDWLMQVVEKIGNYHYPDYYGSRGRTEDDGDYDDCPYPRTFGMRDKEGNYMVRFNANTLFHASTLKEATWLAVVDFIQWHNQQKLGNKI